MRFYGDKKMADAVYRYVWGSQSSEKNDVEIRSDYEPLTPDDIAEIIVFAAGRRENVVIADTLIFPNQQAGTGPYMYKKPN